MEREKRARGQDKVQSQRQATPEAPKLEGAAADLARAMSLLPRAELDMPPEQLFEDHPHYRALVRATNQILWLADADGAGLAGMRDWRAFTGQSEAEVIGQGWFNAVHPDDRPYILEQWRHSVETKEIFREEQRIRRHDGVYRDFTVRVVPVLGEDGELRGWAGACRDVTEQKATLAALHASEKRSRAIREVLETALAHLTLDELLPRLLDRVRDALDANNAVILLPDGNDQLRVRATSGFQAHVNTNVTVPIGRGVAGKIAVDGKPIIIRDLKQVEVVHTLFQQLLSSVVGVPLRMPDGAHGALHVATAAPRDFTEDDVRLLEVVAERISVAIERAQLHEAMAERAVRLKAIIESMTDAVLICDQDGEIVSFNPAAAELDLATRVDTIEEPAYQAFQRVLRRVLRGKTVPSAEAVEVKIARPDGEEVELSLSGAPFWEREGNDTITPVGGVFVFHDVTERRIAERKTADALDGMLSMVERLVAKDDDESVPWTNQTGQRLVEGAATALGSPRVALVAWDEETDLLASVATIGFTARASDPTWHFPDGQVRLSDFLNEKDIAKLRADIPIPLDVSIIPPQVEAGFHDLLLVPARIRERLMGLMVVDASHPYAPDEILLAQAIARLAALLLERDRVDREREEARASATALKVANERLDAFLSMAGHELRTPLTNVKGFLQLTASRLQPGAKRVAGLTGNLNTAQQAVLADLLEHARALLAQAESESNLIQRVVDDILDAEQIRSGRLEIRPEPCDLVSVVRDTINTSQIHAAGRKIILKAGDGSPITVQADAQRTKQALSNYLNNALKYAPAEHPIVVMIRAPVASIPTCALDQANHQPECPVAQVTVRDSGPGLPESEQKRIWDRFARAEATERRKSGLGLGLFITRSIIELHSGQTWVESEPGAGCAFSFTLPLCAPPNSE
ncbi:MAG TPA: PAS domain S-box protein [Ktedonobacterales bacterium]